MNTKNIKSRFLNLYRAPIFSPKGFLVRAAVIGVIYLALHAAGFREYTSIVCGSSPTGNPADTFSNVLGVAYLVFYFACVIGVPMLLIAAGILSILGRLMKRPETKRMYSGN